MDYAPEDVYEGGGLGPGNPPSDGGGRPTGSQNTNQGRPTDFCADRLKEAGRGWSGSRDGWFGGGGGGSYNLGFFLSPDLYSLPRYDYKIAREYNWNVKNKASKGYEENYFFIFREGDGVYYNELETR